MTKNKQLGLYKSWNVEKAHTSIGLFRELGKVFPIKNVLYPGSYVHITPSLIFPKVTYVDSFRNTYKFYEDKEVLNYVKKNKEYPEDPNIRFFQQDYNVPVGELGREFDLVISQYAGFVGQAAKPYLKKGGLLVCNNSHGDASMASLDFDYELIAVYQRDIDDVFSISDKNINKYLIPKNGIKPTKEQLSQVMKGIEYTESPSGYIFKKIV